MMTSSYQQVPRSRRGGRGGRVKCEAKLGVTQQKQLPRTISTAANAPHLPSSPLSPAFPQPRGQARPPRSLQTDEQGGEFILSYFIFNFFFFRPCRPIQWAGRQPPILVRHISHGRCKSTCAMTCRVPKTALSPPSSTLGSLLPRPHRTAIVKLWGEDGVGAQTGVQPGNWPGKTQTS